MIVVDDGLPQACAAALPLVVNGIKPFIFARNCNLGIRRARGDNVVLLNDDAILMTPRGFSALAAVAVEHREYGVISAVTNRTGNENQKTRHLGQGCREELNTLAFTCVYIPRATIDKVGLLDEDYTDYGRDDGDYCERVKETGLRLALCEGCFVDHASLPSSFRDRSTGPSFVINDAVFLRKHERLPA